MHQNLLPKDRPSARVLPIEIRDVHEAGALGFMPRMFVLATLPHSQPKADRFVRVNGRYSLRLTARRSIGLPYGIYPRLILVYLTTQAIRTKNREIGLGRTPGDFARKLGLTPISGPRGTTTRLRDQLQRLCSTRLSWQYTKGFQNRESASGFIATGTDSLQQLTARLLRMTPNWSPSLVLGREFFLEITSSAVPVDHRAIQHLKRSPLAIDLYIWLTYRMSHLRKPTVVPWKSLEAQFGGDYTRPRDFRLRVSKLIEAVLCTYPTVRISLADTGLMLHPSPPHVQARSHKQARRSGRRLVTGGSRHSL